MIVPVPARERLTVSALRIGLPDPVALRARALAAERKGDRPAAVSGYDAALAAEPGGTMRRRRC